VPRRARASSGVKRPDGPRPYRAIGYLVLPAVYILMAVLIDVVLLRYKPPYTWPGLIIFPARDNSTSLIAKTR
jgi:hypothetical protein